MKPERRAGMISCSKRSAKSVAYSRLNDHRSRMLPSLAISIVLDMRLERVQPVVMTPYPCTSSHSCNISMCVERPTPSVPSMAMSFPLRSLGFRYVKPSPKYCASTMGSPSWFVIFERLSHELAHLVLLGFDVFRRIHRNELKLVDDLLVLGQDIGLKNTEAFGDVLGQVHIHAGFVILELPPRASEEPRDGHLDWDPIVEGHVRGDGEAVELANPFRRYAAHHVTREGRVHVAVGQDDHAGLERGQNFMIEAARKVGRVQQAERRRCQALVLLSPFGCIFDQLRGVPFREEDSVAF